MKKKMIEEQKFQDYFKTRSYNYREYCNCWSVPLDFAFEYIASFKDAGIKDLQKKKIFNPI